MEDLENKIKEIAIKYADLVEIRLNSTLNAEKIESTVMIEINDGIRMLNHIAATLERISRLKREYEVGGHYDNN